MGVANTYFGFCDCPIFYLVFEFSPDRSALLVIFKPEVVRVVRTVHPNWLVHSANGSLHLLVCSLTIQSQLKFAWYLVGNEVALYYSVSAVEVRS